MQTNGKRRRHWAGGFTLSEILITLAILGFIAALSVPMLGQQKLKKPNITPLGHGIFECYYGDDGLLHQHYADSNGENNQVVNGRSCRFTIPKANYYAITTIGAGGDGGYLDRIPHYTIGSEEDSPSPSISTDQNFYSDLHGLSSDYAWVLNETLWNGINYWDAAGVRVNYDIQASIGTSGDGDYHIITRGGPECAKCSTHGMDGNAGCPASCINLIEGKGGDSGRAYLLYVKNVVLNSNDSVVFSEGTDMTLRIGNKSATVLGAPSGSDAKCWNHACRHGANGVTPSPIFRNNGFEQVMLGSYKQNPGGYGKSDYYGSPGVKKTTAGSITPNPASISITSEHITIKPYYGESGSVGDVVTRLYEKLPKYALVAEPAIDKNGRTSIYFIDENGNNVYISRADAGEDGKEAEIKTYSVKSNSDLPFPSVLHDTVAPKIPNVFSTIRQDWNSQIAGITNTPGTSGYGAYPFIKNISKVLNRQIGNIPFRTQKTFSTNEALCWNGSAPIMLNERDGYCAATQGGKGAVKIEW